MVIRLKKLLTVLACTVLAITLLACGMGVVMAIDTRADDYVPIRQLDPEKPMVALTFDDGPYGPVTKRIVKALQEVDGRATFFVVGSRIEGREESIRVIADAGCEFGNHTYDHVNLRSRGSTSISEQLKKTDEALEKVAGRRTTVLRPPGGTYSKNLSTLTDLPIVLWTIDTMDWSHQNCARSVKRVLDNVHDGDIILMHDLFLPTAEAAEKVIDELTEQGYQLVTVSELLAYRDSVDGILVKNDG